MTRLPSSFWQPHAVKRSNSSLAKDVALGVEGEQVQHLTLDQCACAPEDLGNPLRDHASPDIRQSIIATLKAMRQLEMIQAELMQHRRM